MRHPSAINIGVAALLSLGLASCVPSKNPLSDPQHAIPDAALYGTWYGRDKNGNTDLLVIGRLTEAAKRSELPAGLMRAAKVTISRDYRVGASASLVFFVTSTGTKTYVNSFGEDAFDRSKHPTFNRAAIDSFLIMKYRLAGARLEFWNSYSVKALGEAIERGVVQGTVEYDKRTRAISGARLTDTTENLAKFFESPEADAVFPDESKQEYRRLPVPQ